MSALKHRAAMEQCGPVVYINDDKVHCCMSVYNPAVFSICPASGLAQLVVSVDTALDLRAALNAFLAQHGVKAN